MSSQPQVKPLGSQLSRQLPLRLVLVVPFVVQIFAAVGLTGYFSLRNGQEAVNDLANQLQSEVSSRIEQHLNTFLATPHKINQINADAIQLGLLNLQDQKETGHYFWKQIQAFNVGYIAATLATGEFTASGYDYVISNQAVIDEISAQTQWKDYAYETDSQGNRIKIAAIYDDYNPRKEDWYSRSLQMGKPVWSQVYSWDDFPEILAISAGYPLYNQEKKPIAVLNVDLRLAQISTFLQQLKISPSGKTWIIERNGLLIGSSAKEMPFRMVEGKAERLKAVDSKEPLIRATAVYLTEQFGNLNAIQKSQQLNFPLNGDRQFATVTPWRDSYGLDWLIVVAVPESDFMAQINENTRTTILLCIVALLIASFLAFLTSKWITDQIRRLSEASQAIASGNLDQTIVVKGIREIGTLAGSFNRMAEQLKASFTALQKANEDLEKRVEERTTDLKLATEAAESAKDAAEVANQAKSEFLANMSHELRTPLNGILGYAQILQRDKTLTPKQQDGLGIIGECGSHLLQLINDILDLSKIEANKLELSPTEVDFEEFLEGVCQICSIRAEQKEIGFSYQPLNQLPTVIEVDEKRLRQILINLLGNAIKFTNEGSVTFTVGLLEEGGRQEVGGRRQEVGGRREQKVAIKGDLGGSKVFIDEDLGESKIQNLKSKISRVRFQVEDTGVGMTEEQLEKIFLPFEQVGDSSDKAQGTGLGLAISRKIVEMMGSEILVESSYAKGSKFWFDLDLPEATNSFNLSTSPLKPNNIIGYQENQKTILIIDDRWENRSVIVNLLEPLGFRMIEAINGQEGLEKARKLYPDLIITDLAMPVMGGLEMVRQLRELEDFQHVTIIASSASVFNFNRQQSGEAGCNDFLPKPIQENDLLSQLQKYLALTWIYEIQEETIVETSAAEKPMEESIPPFEELQVLYKAAKGGYITEIQAEANRLRQLDPQYSAFADQVLALAEAFEDEAIAQLILVAQEKP